MQMRFSGPANVGRAIDRVVATAQNGIEIIRYGGLQTGTVATPFTVVETTPMYKLRHYGHEDSRRGSSGSDQPRDGGESTLRRAPVLLIPPMMVSAKVYDVNGAQGAVCTLREAGLDPWVIDFGSPAKVEGGMTRNLTDHVVAVSEAVDQIRELTGMDVHIGGYSQGGMFAYQTAAYRRSVGLASIITFGSPVDFLDTLPVVGINAPVALIAPGANFLADNVFDRLAISDWMVKYGFQLLDPIKTAKSRLDFLLQLHDRAALLPREDQRRFLDGEGWVAWPGPAIAELLRQVVAGNRMVSGGMVIDGALVTLAEITCPVLAFIGTTDDIGQARSVRSIRDAAPLAETFETSVPAGHFGLVVGSTAIRDTWPTVAQWVLWREDMGKQPEAVVPMKQDDDENLAATIASRMTQGIGAAAEVGAVAGRDLAGAVSSVARTSQVVLRESVRALPRMIRLGQIQPQTRVSLGRLMNEHAQRTPHHELFLFEDRVLSHGEVNRRIDNVVRGLIACGVRPGQPVGVMMETRPSSLVAIAALSRVGAVVVLLTPRAPVHEPMELAGASVIVTDPVNISECIGGVERVLVLGGGDARSVDQADGESVIDMEQIDPATVELPDWYRPDPGLAGDVGFVLFTRNSGVLEKWPITNHRFAQSAFGAATAASLSSNDTVYCLPPLHHASGLLTTLGATVAGGARIALSSGLDPQTFAVEVPRYGVTVVSYTWSMLADVLDATSPNSRWDSSIRLFMGSGMSSGLWNRVLDKFPNSRVLEFFAMSDGAAILANISGTKIGSVGRPLPETKNVRLAAYDAANDQFITDSRGFVREARAGEVGLMLAEARQRYELSATIHRDVFAPHDRWENCQHLFWRDHDGNFTLVGTVKSVIHSADGLVYRQPISESLSLMTGVNDVVVYALGEPGNQIAVAAMDLVPGAANPTVSALRVAVADLPAAQRPHIIRIVDQIPQSPAYRPRSAALRDEGMPKPGAGTWYRDENGRYRRLTRTAIAEIAWYPH